MLSARAAPSLVRAARLCTAATRRVTADALVRHVDVSPVAETSTAFVGRSVDLGWGRVYGGQTMAQALAACQKLVGGDFSVHQLSCHFLRGGDVSADIRFDCEVLSHGRSFSAIAVRASQEGAPILAMTASFQRAERGLEHQDGLGPLARGLPAPEDLPTLADRFAPHLAKVPPRLRQLYSADANPLDLRPCEFVAPWDESVRAPRQAVWVRAKDPLPPGDEAVHQRLLTYFTDWALLGTALQPHPTAMWRRELQAASLSHSVTFHRPFRMDAWLCHVMRSPSASGGRGFALGEVWSEDGRLVASTSQEGLMRVRSTERDRPAG